MSEERPRLRVTTPPPDKKAQDDLDSMVTMELESWEVDRYYPPPSAADSIPQYTSTFDPQLFTPHASSAPATATTTHRSPDYGRRSPDYSRRSPDYSRRSPSPRYGRSTDPRGPQTREQAPFVDRPPNTTHPHRHHHRGGGPSRGGGRQYNGAGASRPHYRQNDHANAAVVFDLLFSIPVAVWHRHGFHPPMRFHEERQYFANFYASDAARAQ